MRRPLLLAASLLTAGCAVQPVQFTGPNGNVAYSMRCSGMGRTLDACYQKAGEVCPRGYIVVDRASSFVAVPMGNSFAAAPQHNLAIECKS